LALTLCGFGRLLLFRDGLLHFWGLLLQLVLELDGGDLPCLPLGDDVRLRLLLLSLILLLLLR
jgi:hypothetical protein